MVMDRDVKDNDLFDKVDEGPECADEKYVRKDIIPCLIVKFFGVIDDQL